MVDVRAAGRVGGTCGCSAVSLLDRVVENADGSRDCASLHAFFREVRRVADHHLGFNSLCKLHRKFANHVQHKRRNNIIHYNAVSMGDVDPATKLERDQCGGGCRRDVHRP
jgi:hypothetical protein